MVQEIELSIAETNMLRAQLGLLLIPDPEESRPEEVAGTLTTEGANRLRMSLGLRPKQEEVGTMRGEPTRGMEKNTEMTRLGEKKSKKQNKLFYNDIESTESWLENIGKKKSGEQKSGATREATSKTEDLDTEFTLAHGDLVSELRDGEVLTLEDGGILEEDQDDILVSEKMQKLAKEERDMAERKKQALLEYGLRERFEDDDEIVKHNLKVTIKGSQIHVLKTQKEGDDEKSKGVKKVIFDDLDDLDPPKAPVKMKKIKKAKKPSKKRSREDDSVEDTGPMFTVALDDEEEDDELELMLASARKNKQKQRKMMTAEQIAIEVRLHLRADAMSEIRDGFVYDDTRDFFDTLQHQREQDIADSGKDGDVAESGNDRDVVESKEEVADSKREVAVADSREELEKRIGIANGSVKGEKELPPIPQGSNLEASEDTSGDSVENSGPKFTTLLDTLKYLRQNGQAEENQYDKVNRQAQKEAELNRIKISIEERIVREELLNDHSYIGALNDEKEKIFDRVLNDRLVAKGIVQAVSRGKYSRYTSSKVPLSSYNPKVRLRYTDRSGQELDTKQAWKELLHKYHGLEPKHKKQKGKSQEPKETVIG